MRTTGYVIGAMLLVLLGATLASMLILLNDHGILMSRGETGGMMDSMMGDIMSGGSSVMGSMMSGSAVTNTTGMINGTRGSMMNGVPNGMLRGYTSLMGRMMVRSTMPMLGSSVLPFLLWPALLLIVAGGGLLAWLALARRPQNATSDQHSVLDILNLRYAKGEINKEQFEEMRHTFRS